jgi:hypothetical protein
MTSVQVDRCKPALLTREIYALAATDDSQLNMRLGNIPIPLAADMVDEPTAPELYVAVSGERGSDDLELMPKVSKSSFQGCIVHQRQGYLMLSCQVAAYLIFWGG